MRTRNPNYDRAKRLSEGATSPRNAGSRGITFRDSSTEAHPIRDLTFVGGTLTDNDDGTAILTISGSAGDPSSDVVSKTGGGGYAVYTNSAAGSSLTIDLSIATVFDITLTANCTLAFSNPPADGEVSIWILILRQGGSGSYTVTWPGAVTWQDSDGTSGGSAPPLFTAVDAVDVVHVTTADGGATYGGASLRGDHRLLLNLTTGDPHTQYVLKSLVDAKGDLLAGTAADTVARLAVGTDGQVLTARASATAGVAWEAPGADETSHVHVVEETHLSDGSTVTWTLDNYFVPGSVIAWNTTTIARLTVTEVEPDRATVSAAGTTGDKIVFDYAASAA